jgi:hypothetical protein
MFKHLKAVASELKLADFVLIILILAIGTISAINVFKTRDDAVVSVYKGDRLWGEYPLDVDRVIRVDEHNTFQIKDGKVSMIHADCPDKRCVKQGSTSKLPIVCLPNKLIIQIKSQRGEAPHVLY